MKQFAIENTINKDYTNDFEMSVKTLMKIWNNLQRNDAKHAMFREERKKIEPTKAEILNKLVQFGKVLRYKNICFYVEPESNWYCLVIGKQRIYNTSISDFYTAVEKTYGVPIREKLGIA